MTGILPVALDKATRVVQTLLKAGKEYVCLMHLHKEIEEEKIKDVLENFVGKIKQLPPVRSAVKRQERVREIYYIEILEIDEQDVLFRVGCEAGTYIRKLCHDIGRKLKVGAHMAQLIRTKAGPFYEKDWVSLQDLADAYADYKENGSLEIKKFILPMERAVEHLPKIWVFDNCVESLCHGSDLKVPGISKLNKFDEEMVAVFSLKDELICIGESIINSKEMMEKEKGLVVKVNKVFMERGTYSE